MIVLPSMPLRNPNVGLVYHGLHFNDGECDTIVASAIDSEWREGGVGAMVQCMERLGSAESDELGVIALMELAKSTA